MFKSYTTNENLVHPPSLVWHHRSAFRHISMGSCGHLLRSHLMDIFRLLSVSFTTLSFKQSSSIYRFPPPPVKLFREAKLPLQLCTRNFSPFSRHTPRCTKKEQGKKSLLPLLFIVEIKVTFTNSFNEF